MNYIGNLFASIKIMFLQVITAELAVIRMIVSPSSLREYILVFWGKNLYIQHIGLSIVFVSLGALIFLKKTDFFVQNKQE